MKVFERLFTVLFLVVFTTLSAFGNSNCSNEYYRRTYPEKCKNTNNNTFLTLAGGAALVGIGVALASHTNGSHGSSSTVSNQSNFPRTPLSANIVINYAPTDYVQNQQINAIYLNSLTNGNDIDANTINSIKSSQEYQRNYRQYDAIKFAWAKARDFSGKNTNNR